MKKQAQDVSLRKNNFLWQEKKQNRFNVLKGKSIRYGLSHRHGMEEDTRGDSSGLHLRPGSEGSTSKTCVCSFYTSSEHSLRCARYKPGTLGTA